MNKRFRKIYVEITNVCNLKCSFCPTLIRKTEFMTIEKFEYIANVIAEYTDLIYLHVKGEPLLHRNLYEILLICEKYGLMVNLTTNGTLLKENLDVLKNSKSIRQINISIHSSMVNKNSNEYIEKYMNNVIYSANQLEGKIISYRLWNIKDKNSIERNKQILNILEREYNVSELLDMAIKTKSIKLKEKVYINQDIQFEWPNINGKEHSVCGKCLGLKEQIAILVNGDVVPCCLDENGNMRLGNIFEEDLDIILNSKYSKKIKEGFDNNKLVSKLCRTCGFRTRFDKEV